jgi:potassium efflux system protein
MIKTARLLLAALVLTSFSLAAPLVPKALAQNSAPANAAPASNLGARVDALSATLANIEKTLKTTKPGQSALDEMRQSVKPIVTASQAMVDHLTPGIAALKARVDQLGPAPGPKAPPEPPEVTKERVTAQAAYDEANGLLKRAKLLATEAEQDDYFLSVRQRAAFNRNLFQRETSILDPQLWFGVISETPDNVQRIAQSFADWGGAVAAKLNGANVFLFWGGIVVVLLLYWPLRWLTHRVVRLDPKAKKPSRWRKVLLACWVSFSIPAVFITLTYGLAYVCAFVAVPDSRLQSLFAALQGGVIRVAVAAGLARGILSPGNETWRLSRLDTTTCDKLIRIVVAVAVIVSGTRIFEAVNDVINASLPFSVATRGVGALLVAGAIAAALYSLGEEPKDDRDSADGHGTAAREWPGLARGVTWTIVLAITAAVLVGYVAFGDFLVEQIVLVGGTGAIFFLAVSFADEACAAGFQPNNVLGRSLIYSIGLRREGLDQIAILLSGAIRLVLITVATLAVMVPWGLQSTDIPSNLYAIFFGFKVGEVTVSLAGIAFAILIFLGIIAATRGIQGWLENRYLPLTRLDSGLQNSIKISLGYAGFVLALAVAAADLGVDFQKLAIVAGALSVGIGFGLQSIVNNFVSGLILLWERAVRVGDWIVVGSDQGYVRRINVRSTEIETFDRASVVIPNSNLVSGVVKNLMRTDKVGRLIIEVTVNSASNPEKVREVLLDIARNQDGVLTIPSPQVRFTNLTAAAMSFDLYCFVADVESVLRTKSDLYFEIHKQFAEFGFFNGPAPDPLAIKIDGLDKLETILHGTNGSSRTPRSAKAAPGNPNV